MPRTMMVQQSLCSDVPLTSEDPREALRRVYRHFTFSAEATEEMYPVWVQVCQRGNCAEAPVDESDFNASMNPVFHRMRRVVTERNGDYQNVELRKATFDGSKVVFLFDSESGGTLRRGLSAARKKLLGLRMKARAGVNPT